MPSNMSRDAGFDTIVVGSPVVGRERNSRFICAAADFQLIEMVVPANG
jgi:D-serine deaminase-like pyridoxal phosphate-dependent protein